MEDDLGVEPTVTLSESASSDSSHGGLHHLLEEIIAGMPGFITGYLSAHPRLLRRRRRRHSSSGESQNAQAHNHDQMEINNETHAIGIQMTPYISPAGVLDFHVHPSEISMTPYISPEVLGFHVHFDSESFRRPPAPISLIWALPAKMIDEEMLVELQQSSNSCCSICLDDFLLGKEAIALSCNHLFHSSCIRRWLLETNSCPVCREGRAVRRIIQVSEGNIRNSSLHC